MKILIDECVPRRIKQLLSGHEAQTVQELGYSGYLNGELLRIAEDRFDLFITSDQNLRYQQNLTERTLAILMLSTNDWKLIENAAGSILSTVDTIKSAEFIELEL